MRLSLLNRSIIYVVLIFMFILVAYPIVWMVISALKTNAEILAYPLSLPSRLNFDNFSAAWIEGKFGAYFFNSVFITLTSLTGIIFFSLLASYALARLDFPGRRIFTYLWLLGLMIPPHVVLIPSFKIMVFLNLIDNPLSLIFTYIGGTSMAVLIMRAFFATLPRDLENAARIDGCSELGIFWKIALPLAKPAIGVIAIFYFVFLWNEFLFPLIYLRDERFFTVTLGLMNFRGQYRIDYALMFAALTIAAVPPIIGYLIFQKNFIKGLTAGALKF